MDLKKEDLKNKNIHLVAEFKGGDLIFEEFILSNNTLHHRVKSYEDFLLFLRKHNRPDNSSFVIGSIIDCLTRSFLVEVITFEFKNYWENQIQERGFGQRNGVDIE